MDCIKFMKRAWGEASKAGFGVQSQILTDGLTVETKLDVKWNQGIAEVECAVVTDGEFKAYLELMGKRGWRDRFVLWYE